MILGVASKYFESREEESLYELVASLALRKLFMQVLSQSFSSIFLNFFLSDNAFLMNLNQISEQ